MTQETEPKQVSREKALATILVLSLGFIALAVWILIGGWAGVAWAMIAFWGPLLALALFEIFLKPDVL